MSYHQELLNILLTVCCKKLIQYYEKSNKYNFQFINRISLRYNEGIQYLELGTLYTPHEFDYYINLRLDTLEIYYRNYYDDFIKTTYRQDWINDANNHLKTFIGKRLKFLFDLGSREQIFMHLEKMNEGVLNKNKKICCIIPFFCKKNWYYMGYINNESDVITINVKNGTLILNSKTNTSTYNGTIEDLLKEKNYINIGEQILDKIERNPINVKYLTVDNAKLLLICGRCFDDESLFNEFYLPLDMLKLIFNIAYPSEEKIDEKI